MKNRKKIILIIEIIIAVLALATAIINFSSGKEATKIINSNENVNININ